MLHGKSLRFRSPQMLQGCITKLKIGKVSVIFQLVVLNPQKRSQVCYGRLADCREKTMLHANNEKSKKIWQIEVLESHNVQCRQTNINNPGTKVCRTVALQTQSRRYNICTAV